jgi:hypothetical protein
MHRCPAAPTYGIIPADNAGLVKWHGSSKLVQTAYEKTRRQSSLGYLITPVMCLSVGNADFAVLSG